MTPPTPSEYTLVEKPIIDLLTSEYDYHYIPPKQHREHRGPHQNEVFFTPLLIESLTRINNIPEATAKTIAAELQNLSNNQRWLDILRGHYSKKIPGEDTHRRIRLVDFTTPSNNHFAVTNQLRIQGRVTCIPDLVIYLNGIPIVVIEAKSPLSPTQNTWNAVAQIRQYETNAPRLFAPNLFNIATNDLTFLYAATGSPTDFWMRWRDPWPRNTADFSDQSAQGIYALLAPRRLLDILAHFIVFETNEGKTIKKICRYQQFRAVNKMVDRVVEGNARQGLIWHTQGSGKSLTMVFAALKLKFHRGIHAPTLKNPNLLVLTDRKDLHAQLAGTFNACGLPNPQEATDIKRLQALVVPGVSGRTVMSTIFKFRWDEAGLKSDDMATRKAALANMEVANSDNWILMVDEAHRTQEKELGAYLRAILPHATRFGFTGTPVKKGDKDTFLNFGVPGESYLDKYGIQDAVDDGATVPVYYQGRLTDWQLEGAKLDILFDQYFANESEERIEEIKARGVTRGDLARFKPRIDTVAFDIWTHFRTHLQPDGFKAQIVAIDRPACVLYKQALDRVITETFVAKGMNQEEAEQKASAMSVCIYSKGQHDQDKYPALVKYQLDEQAEKAAIEHFKQAGHDLQFLIVCNKLLTGFDAPIEQTMYLDSPLYDHGLLQAIARTNRRYGPTKTRGTIVDYIGISKNLATALAAYNDDDIQGAMTDEHALYADLQTAHQEVMELLQHAPRSEDLKQDALAAVPILEAAGTWPDFLGKANRFLVAYGTLTPDPRVLAFTVDFQYVGTIIPYGKMNIDADTHEVDWRNYSEKVREILHQHLKVTGLSTVIKLRSMADPSFWEDFTRQADDPHATAVRKLVELKKETLERSAQNPARYSKFSEHIQKLIHRFQQGLLDAAEVMDQARKTAEAVQQEDRAFEQSGLNEQAYDVLKTLERFSPENTEPTTLHDAAKRIDALYQDDEAPAHWQHKPQSRKELLRQVRRIVHPLRLTNWPAFKTNLDELTLRTYAKSP